MDSIRVLTTGGTIEGYLDPSDKDRTPLLPTLLENARLTVKYELESVFAKDSRAIDDSDRQSLLEAIESCKESHVLISHGTITMCETAMFLGERNIDKHIVLVGAMVPANEKNSDAEFNLGAAVMALSQVNKGVYVVMNGHIFNYDNVRKNTTTGFFEELS